MRVKIQVICDIDDKFLDIHPFACSTPEEEQFQQKLQEECVEAIEETIGVPYSGKFVDDPDRWNKAIGYHGVFTEVQAQKTGWEIITI